MGFILEPLTVTGYHGTTRKIADKILSENFVASVNDWDWLGHARCGLIGGPKSAPDQMETVQSWLPQKFACTVLSTCSINKECRFSKTSPRTFKGITLRLKELQEMSQDQIAALEREIGSQPSP